MRLIDADELKERFCEENCGKNRCVDHMDKCAWILSVEESKTAFDADKVVEQLEKLADEANDKILEAGGLQLYYDGYEDAMRTAVEIVKGGGVE